MKGGVTSLVVTNIAASPGEAYVRFAKLSAPAYLWCARDGSAPLTSIQITYENQQKPDDDLKNHQEIKTTFGTNIWVSTEAGDSPIIDLRVTTGQVDPGFILLPQVLNPQSGLSEFLCVKTQKSQAKVDNAEYSVGDFVDVLDTYNKWLRGRIVQVNNEKDDFFIHYEGWADKWNEWIPRRSPRIAPHGKYTKNKDTGWEGDRSAFKLVSDMGTFDIVSARMAAMVQMPECPVARLSDDDRTFLLDHNLNYVTKVLNSIIDDPKVIPRAQKYLQDCLRMTVRSLKLDEQVPEAIITTLIKIFNGDEARFYRKYGILGDETDVGGQFACRPAKSEDSGSMSSAYLIRNINFFGESGGFEYLRTRTSKDSKDTVKSVGLMWKTIDKIGKVIAHEFKTQYVKSLCLQEVTLYRIQKISDDELKTLTKEVLVDFLATVRSLLEKFLEKNALSEFYETAKLEIAFRQLKSEILEKRIHGISSLQNIIKHSSERERFSNNDGWMTTKRLIKWINDRKFVQLVLGPDSHEQIVKRSPGILKFLSKHDSLSVEHLNLLWGCASGKHEGLVRIVYDTLADLAQALKSEHLDALYTRIAEKPFSGYLDYDLTFVKHFTVNAVNAHRSENKWYGLNLFWEIIQDEAKVGDDIAEMSMTILKDLLHSQPMFHSQRLLYLEKCMDNLRDGCSTAQSLKVAKLIIQMYPQHSMSGQFSMADLIGSLEEKCKLLKLLVMDATKYNMAARTIQQQRNGADPSLSTRYPHSAQISARLDFLRFVLTCSNLTLERQHIDQLWHVLYTGAVSEQDKDALLKWLGKSFAEEVSGVYAIFASGVAEYVFESILCNPQKISCADISLEGYKCFEIYFLNINYMRKCLVSPSRRGMVVMDYRGLVGLEALWKMCYCKVPTVPQQGATVAQHSTTLLTGLHVRINCQMLPEERKYVFKSFIESAMERLRGGLEMMNKQVPSTEGFVDQTVALLHLFLKRCNNGDVIRLPQFAVGDHVVARFKQARMRPHDAEILSVNPNGTYLIKWGEDSEDQVSERMLMANPNLPKPTQRGQDHYYPRELLSQSHFDLLLELLGAGGTVGRKMWDLLGSLPVNTSYSGKIKELSIKDSNGAIDWNALLPTSSNVKLLYTLQIIEEEFKQDAVSEQQKLVRNEWGRIFVTQGGFAHICGVIANKQVEVMLADVLSQKCLALLLNLASNFIKDNSEACSSVKNADLVVDRLLLYLEAITNLDQKAGGENEGNRKLADDQRVVGTLVGLLLTLLGGWCKYDIALMKRVHSFGKFEVIISKGILGQGNPFLRTQLRLGLVNFCCQFRFSEQPPSAMLTPIILSLLTTLDKKDSSTLFCEDFFSLAQALLVDTGAGAIENEPGTSTMPCYFDRPTLTRQLCSQIKQHPILETRSGGMQIDYLLGGMLGLAHGLIEKESASLKEELGLECGMVANLFKSLMDVPTVEHRQAGQIPPPKCKSIRSVQIAYRFLAELVKGCDANLRLLLGMLMKIHEPGNRNMNLDWNYEPECKSDTGYVGLKNLGSICYMNALMQQLYMVPKLRSNIMNISEYKEENLEESEVYQLQCTMANLQESEKQHYSPAPFCGAFKDWDGQPINVNIQEDSGGFLSKLTDKVNEKLKGTADEGVFKDVMGGTFSHELIGRNGCTHYKEREEEFYGVTLEVKNKKTIQESLEAFIQGELLEGGNQFKCSQCNKKVDTLKRTCLKKLPNTIAFVLKRFELDYNTLQTEKVNSQLEFPWLLDLKPYTKESLSVPGASDELKEQRKPKEDRPPEYYQFKLKGVVIHAGSATHGHYYSYITDRLKNDNKWYEFNDTIVRPFDVNNLADECFGGVEPQQSQVNPIEGGAWMDKAMEKARNAYLVFYDRVTEESSQMDQVWEREPDSSAKKVVDEIWQQNVAYWKDRAVFDNNYFEFLWKVVMDSGMSAATSQTSGEPGTQLAVVSEESKDLLSKVAFRFALKTLSRSVHKDLLEQWGVVLKRTLIGNVSRCQWVLQELSSPEENLSFEFLLRCHLPVVRQPIGDLICLALKTVLASGTPEGLDSARSYVDCLLGMFDQLPLYWKNFDQYFQVLADFACHDREQAQYLCGQNMVARLVDFYLGDASMHRVNKLPTNDKGQRYQMRDGWRSPEFTDFFRLLSALVCVAETSTDASGLCGFQDRKLTLSLLLGQQFLVRMLQECTSRKKGGFITRILIHHCRENEQISQQVIGYSSSAIEEHTWEFIRPYFRVFMSLVKLEDSMQDRRVEWVLSSLLSVMEEQSRFWKITDMCIEHLIRLAKKSPKCHMWLHHHGNQLNWILSWLEIHRNPPYADSRGQNGIVLYKRNRNNQNWTASPCGLLISQKKAALEFIKAQQPLDSDGSDSDEDLLERVFVEGQKIDCLDNSQKWASAQIARVAGDRVEVCFLGMGDAYNEWLHKGDMRIAPAGKWARPAPSDTTDVNDWLSNSEHGATMLEDV